jgi:hypothetical protein
LLRRSAFAAPQRVVALQPLAELTPVPSRAPARLRAY